MKCPSCRTIFSGPPPQCPNCRLDLHRLDLKFGAIPRHSHYLTDAAGRLPRREAGELHRLLRLFNRKFPQSRFSVFLTNQGPQGEMAEYSFWLMNRARLGFIEAVAGQNFDLLLAIDVAHKTAALVIGYGLENYLTERDLERALAGATSGFYAGDFARGIRDCVELIMNRMREVVRKLEDEFLTQNAESDGRKAESTE